jgi:hypothetical protein
VIVSGMIWRKATEKVYVDQRSLVGFAEEHARQSIERGKKGRAAGDPQESPFHLAAISESV